MATEKILVVDDDSNIAELLRLYLEKEGYEVFTANNGGDAVKVYKEKEPDLMLLDIMLPVLDGWQVCREVRKFSEKPIIMITAKGSEIDKVKGLDAGADDYIAKPFGILEFISRVKALLRRAGTLKADSEEQTSLSLGGVCIDMGKRIVTADGGNVELTYKEYELLKLLMSQPGLVYSRQQILEKIWGIDFKMDTRTVDMHIKTLRQKLGEQGSIIQTVRNVGYKAQ